MAGPSRWRWTDTNHTPGGSHLPGSERSTKLDLIRYDVAVADGALRGVARRPMILKDFVRGIEQ